MAPKRSFPETDIYCITAREFSLGRSNIDVVRNMLEAGIKVVQYREKELSMREKYGECASIRKLTTQHSACFIVNDDVALALAVDADGIHVGQDDLPVDVVRRLVGERTLIGLSTHSPAQAEAAIRAGIVDYIGVGPLYQTFTKKDVQAPVGLGYLDYVKQHCRMPFVAIGGIKEANVADVVRHGARTVCLVTEITGADDIPAKIRAIRNKIATSDSE
jgi:thiamine-phosphate pyrophosphorylase